MTILGLSEIGAVRATIDTKELGDINPDSRADVAVNFDSELLPVARSGGVLLAGVTPTVYAASLLADGAGVTSVQDERARAV